MKYAKTDVIKYLFIFLILIQIFQNNSSAQDKLKRVNDKKEELIKKKKNIKKKINQIEKVLKHLNKKKNISLGQLNTINLQINYK